MSNAHPTPAFLAQDIGPQLTIVSAVFIVLVVLFGGLRWYSSHLKARPFGLDDLFSYVGMLFILADCAVGIILVKNGVGRHLAFLERNDFNALIHEVKILYPYEILYISSFTFPKLSILLMYLRIFTTKTLMRNVTYALLVIVALTWLSETLTAIFQCWPIKKSWDATYVGGHCVNQAAMYQYWSIPNIATDAIMLVLPMQMVWKLQISRGRKFALTFSFFLGSIGFIACIVRYTEFANKDTLTRGDPPWTSVEKGIWTIVEPSMYFFAGIIPSLRPMLSLFISKVKTGTHSGGQSFNPSSSGRSGGARGRNNHSNENRTIGSGGGMNKAWSPLHDDDTRPLDSIALVEYSYDVESGKGKGSVARGSEITKIQTVAVTRENV